MSTNNNHDGSNPQGRTSRRGHGHAELTADAATSTDWAKWGWEVSFKPDAWYSEYALRIRGWDEDQLARARKFEGLRCRTIKRGVRWYKGAWLEAWLSRPEAEGQAAAR